MHMASLPMGLFCRCVRHIGELELTISLFRSALIVYIPTAIGARRRESREIVGAISRRGTLSTSALPTMSNPSWAPDESANDLFLERTFMAGDVICGLGYGLSHISQLA